MSLMVVMTGSDPAGLVQARPDVHVRGQKAHGRSQGDGPEEQQPDRIAQFRNTLISGTSRRLP